MSTAEDARRIALELPGAFERPSYEGQPSFRTKARMFALLTHEPKGLLIWCASKPERDGLLEANPTAFSTSRHYAGQPTLLIDLPEVGHDELVELITESWLARAPERLTRDWEPGD